MVATAKIFTNGGSQAVRLPKEFRLDGDEVCIKRIGSVVVLYEKDQGWDFLRDAIGQATDDFMADGREQPDAAEAREPL